MLDAFMDVAGSYVRLLVFDGESCNGILKSAIHGNMDLHHRRRLQDTRFFHKVRHGEIPGLESLPRVPMKIAKLDGVDAVYAMPGPAHATKNALAQACSEGKVLFYGKYPCDASGTLEFNVPIPAFCRKDAMSDRLCSLLSCPLFLAQTKASQYSYELFFTFLCIFTCQPNFLQNGTLEGIVRWGGIFAWFHFIKGQVFRQ